MTQILEVPLITGLASETHSCHPYMRPYSHNVYCPIHWWGSAPTCVNVPRTVWTYMSHVLYVTSPFKSLSFSTEEQDAGLVSLLQDAPLSRSSETAQSGRLTFPCMLIHDSRYTPRCRRRTSPNGSKWLILDHRLKKRPYFSYLWDLSRLPAPTPVDVFGTLYIEYIYSRYGQ